METPRSERLKEQVREFWNTQSCDTQVARAEKFSREYFDQIESFRYQDQPFIHGFAQFTRYRGRKVLEVGVGAGTDFIQWLRAGALASGIDLTAEAIDHVRHRIAAYGLPSPESLQTGDAERLPFPDATFDLGYSFGVLHHTPDTERAVRELVRVVRAGGEIKLMLYNRRSIWAFNLWVKHALMSGCPWKSLAWVMWHHLESTGTKGYTRGELLRMFSALPVDAVHIRTEVTSADYLASSAFPPLRGCWRALMRLAGIREAWLPGDYVQRINDPDFRLLRTRADRNLAVATLTGNPLGFYHCISARKTG